MSRCVILDSSAIFHLRDLTALLSLGDKFYITEPILEEIRDSRAQAVLDLIKPEVVQVDRRRISDLRRLYPELSDADCSIILCAEVLSSSSNCSEIIVVTDDVTLRNILRKRGVRVQTIYFGKRRCSSSRD